MKIYLIVVLGCTLLTQVFSQKPGPKFSANDTINYGDIFADADDGIRWLKFTNTGNAPLVIHNIKGSCGCLVPYWPNYPIQPGVMDSIKVDYDTNNIGPIGKTLSIYVNEEAGKDTEGNTIYKSYCIRVIGKLKAKRKSPSFLNDTNKENIPLEK